MSRIADTEKWKSKLQKKYPVVEILTLIHEYDYETNIGMYIIEVGKNDTIYCFTSFVIKEIDSFLEELTEHEEHFKNDGLTDISEDVNHLFERI